MAVLETVYGALRKARSVNQTSNGYVSKVPTATEPAGDAGTATGASILSYGAPLPITPVWLGFMPYAIGSNNNTFNCRVIGWRPIGEGVPTTALWIPTLLVEVACTVSSSVPGLAGKILLGTEFFADTITLVGTSGVVGADLRLVSPADDASAGHVLLKLEGYQKVEFSFTTGASATSCNALVWTF